MQRGLSRSSAAALLACVTTWALAQSPPADPTTVAHAGLQVMQLIDAGNTAEVWDGSSSAAKKLVPRQEFVQSVNATRQPLGAAQAREWMTVARHESTGTARLPAGSYVNVEYLTRFSTGRSATEMVSFRLDDDKTWRVTGYFLR